MPELETDLSDKDYVRREREDKDTGEADAFFSALII